MHDLIKLNRRIATHWLGSLNRDQELYLSYMPVCIAQFAHTSAELREILLRSHVYHYNALSIAKLNRQYLRFARLGAKDIRAGRPAILVWLGITLDQVEVLAGLSNDELNRLAFGWDGGEIVTFDHRAFVRGAALHTRAALHHAAAFASTRSQTK